MEESTKMENQERTIILEKKLRRLTGTVMVLGLV
jgi:hypothetical protein